MNDGLDLDLRKGVEPQAEPPGFFGGITAWIWDVARSWGPAILAVLVIRSVLVEPFQIPSGSMVPTLAIGDFILVSKFGYGLRVPFTDIELLALDEPKRGDVVVFIHPPSVSEDPWCWAKRLPRGITFDLIPGIPGPDPCTQDYIKRVVGLPGDTVEVRDDIVYINGQEQPRVFTGTTDYTDQYCRTEEMKEFKETLSGVEHTVLQSASYGQRMNDWGPREIPQGSYFMMGDIRDNSADGRIWGFVPRNYIKGRATFVWLSFDPCGGSIKGLGSVRLSRIGTGLK